MIQCSNPDFRTQGGLSHGDGNGTVQIVVVTLKMRMRAYMDVDVKVARGGPFRPVIALAFQTDSPIGIHARRHSDFNFLMRTDRPCTPASGTGIVDHRPLTAAGAAGCGDGKEAGTAAYLSGTSTLGAGSDAFSSRTVTFTTGLEAVVFNLHIHAENGLFEVHPQIVSEIASPGAAAAGTPGSAPASAEERFKNIPNPPRFSPKMSSNPLNADALKEGPPMLSTPANPN
jgi:hypothetical protein